MCSTMVLFISSFFLIPIFVFRDKVYLISLINIFSLFFPATAKMCSLSETFTLFLYYGECADLKTISTMVHTFE